MFWGWISFIAYSMAAVCSIANMSKAEDIWDKIFRMTIATAMLIIAILRGNMMLIAMLEGVA